MSNAMTKIIPSPLVNASGTFPLNPTKARIKSETTTNTANQGVIEITYSLALVKPTKIVDTRKETKRLTNLLSPRILYFVSIAKTMINTRRKLRMGK